MFFSSQIESSHNGGGTGRYASAYRLCGLCLTGSQAHGLTRTHQTSGSDCLFRIFEGSGQMPPLLGEQVLTTLL